MAKICSRLPSSEPLLNAYIRLLAPRLLPTWVTGGFDAHKATLFRRPSHQQTEVVAPLPAPIAQPNKAPDSAPVMGKAHSGDIYNGEASELAYNDVFSATTGRMCALELRVWEKLHRAFEARCPVSPEEQWRVRQIISDIAAAGEIMSLYFSHLQRGICPETEIQKVRGPGSGTSPDPSKCKEQDMQHSKSKLEMTASVVEPPDTGTSGNVPSAESKSESNDAFEALVLTKTAWDIHLPSGALTSSEKPENLQSTQPQLRRFSESLGSVDGLKIPPRLHLHLEVCCIRCNTPPTQ